MLIYKKQVLGRLALKSEPVCFWTLDGSGNLILASCICLTAVRRVSLAATGSTRMIWNKSGTMNVFYNQTCFVLIKFLTKELFAKNTNITS